MSDKLQMFLAGLLVFVLACAFFSVYVAVNSRSETLANGCLAEQMTVNSSLSILLDTTDEYRPVQLKLIKNLLYTRLLELEQYDHLLVYRIDKLQGGILTATIDLCKPAENQVDAPVFRKLKQAQFEEAVQLAFELKKGGYPTSPIIESISLVASDMSLVHKNREIIVVTDLIENSEVISMYRASWENEVDSNEDYLYKVQPTLDGIKVRLLMLARPQVSTQNLDLKKWWIRYLRNSGAIRVELEEIRG
jgi:hypothetical protein